MPEKTFEQAMQRLEKIVQELESGDLPLEKSLQKFEEGIKLSKYCGQILDDTEKRVNLLLKNQEGHIVEKPLKNDTEPEA